MMLQIAIFCGQQGRILRTFRAILGEQLVEISRADIIVLLISIGRCYTRLCFLNQYGKSSSQPALGLIKFAIDEDYGLF